MSVTLLFLYLLFLYFKMSFSYIKISLLLDLGNSIELVWEYCSLFTWRIQERSPSYKSEGTVHPTFRFCLLGILDMNLDIRNGRINNCIGLHLELPLHLAVLGLTRFTSLLMFSSLAEATIPGGLGYKWTPHTISLPDPPPS